MSRTNSRDRSVDLMEHVNKQAQYKGAVPTHHLSHLTRIQAYLAQMGHSSPPEIIEQDQGVGMFHAPSKPDSDFKK